MEANEFRVGNFLDYHGQCVIVLEIKKTGAEFGYFKDSIGFFREYANPDFPKPTSLSIDWLLSFGFENDSITLSKGLFMLSTEFPYACWYKRIGESTKLEIIIEYVHQLQNVYFALTNNELTSELLESKNPEEKGYYLTKTIRDKWGIAYWDGTKFWDDPNQDGKLSFGIKREFIKLWLTLPK